RGSLWGVRLYAVLAACASVLVACEPGCPEGSIAVGDRCVAADGGPPVDAGTDGGRDGGADAGDAQVAEDGGGACECPASTPYCHPSAGCVTCLESAHCESAS